MLLQFTVFAACEAFAVIVVVVADGSWCVNCVFLLIAVEVVLLLLLLVLLLLQFMLL